MRLTLATSAFVLTSLPAAATPGDEDPVDSFLDGMPRTVLTSCPQGAVADPVCFPSHCRTKRRPVGFPNRVCVENTSNPPRNQTLAICMDSTFHTPFYDTVTLPPGGRWWGLIRVPQGGTSWITNWVVDAGPANERNELSYSFDTSDDQDRLVPATAGVVQIGDLDCASPVSSETTYDAIGDEPWSVQRVVEPLQNGMRTIEDWLAAPGSFADRRVTTTVRHDATGYVMTTDVDMARDGTIDYSSDFRYDVQDSGDSTLTLRATDVDGNLVSSFCSITTVGPNGTVVESQFDDDGDGSIDRRKTETIVEAGSVTYQTIEIDEDGNGRAERIEENTIEYRGPYDATQSTSVMSADGASLENWISTTSPTNQGFVVDTLHDTDGDGVHDARATRIASVSRFADGLSQDDVGVDFENDGTYDAFARAGSLRSRDGAVYEEIVAADQNADGSIESLSVRSVDLSSDGE